MSRGESTTGKNRFIKKVLQIARREVPALFIYVAMFAGAMAFCIVLGSYVGIEAANQRHWAVISSLNSLPKVYAKLKDKQVPFLILFAWAFREGFLSPASIAPNLSKLLTKARGFWRNVKRGP
jgi:hypothetical protein